VGLQLATANFDHVVVFWSLSSSHFGQTTIIKDNTCIGTETTQAVSSKARS
jgi:hypothetical protein